VSAGDGLTHHTFPDSGIPAAYGPYSHAVEAGDFVRIAPLPEATNRRFGIIQPGPAWTFGTWFSPACTSTLPLR